MRNATSAEQVLEPLILTFTVPVAALGLRAVAKLLGAHAPRPGKMRSSVATVEIGRADWEWSEGVFEFHDEDGNAGSRVVREDYVFDDYRASDLPRLQAKLDGALRCLGIPFDSELAGGPQGLVQGAVAKARLDPANPTGKCERTTPEPKPSFEKILELARSSKDIARFKDWLEGHADDPRSLEDDAAAFNARLAEEPELGPFIDAGANLIRWCEVRRDQGIRAKPKREGELGRWLSTERQGEGPMKRLARGGLPMGMPQVVEMLRLAVADASIGDKAAGSVLCAFCESWARMSPPKGLCSKVPADYAILMGESLSARPGMSQHLTPGARSYFDTPLEKPAEWDMGGAHAAAEAAWLRAQSLLAIPAAASKKARTL